MILLLNSTQARKLRKRQLAGYCFSASCPVESTDRSKWTHHVVNRYNYIPLMKISGLHSILQTWSYYICQKELSLEFRDGIVLLLIKYACLISAIYNGATLLVIALAMFQRKSLSEREITNKEANKINRTFCRKYLWNVLFQSFTMTVYQPCSFSKPDSSNLYALSTGWEET